MLDEPLVQGSSPLKPGCTLAVLHLSKLVVAGVILNLVLVLLLLLFLLLLVMVVIIIISIVIRIIIIITSAVIVMSLLLSLLSSAASADAAAGAAAVAAAAACLTSSLKVAVTITPASYRGTLKHRRLISPGELAKWWSPTVAASMPLLHPCQKC